MQDVKKLKTERLVALKLPNKILAELDILTTNFEGLTNFHAPFTRSNPGVRTRQMKKPTSPDVSLSEDIAILSSDEHKMIELSTIFEE